MRKMQPFCIDCGATELLEVDHIVPLAEAPELAYEPLNLAVRCRHHNRTRGTSVTDAERQMVRDAIAARRRRVTAV
jgi:5-methylcytosine-specific restriction endonuclease McrA